MVTRIRNKGCTPNLSSEGLILKPLPTVKSAKRGNWWSGLKPHERMHAHQTLASVRRYAHFKPFSGLIPSDELDFVITSPYDHGKETFPDKVDPLLQAETLGINTWRRLRNTRDLKPERDAKGPALSALFVSQAGVTLQRYSDSHPVLIGGIKEREHPSHVKLMNSSHHSPQTNAGYIRKDRDGTFFQY